MLKLYICYVIVFRKWSDYIKKLINWQLFSNNEEFINNKEVSIKLQEDILIYEEKDAINKINLKDKYYIRENNEYKFEIYFENNLCKYTLKENDMEFSSPLSKSNFTYLDNIITLEYRIDDEDKKIIIHML